MKEFALTEVKRLVDVESICVLGTQLGEGGFMRGLFWCSSKYF